MLLAWAALNLSLFGAGDRADKYVQDVVNTHFGKLLYNYPPHDEITVLLLTDHALNTAEEQGRWPARYDFHGRVLKAVRTHSPQAVFIDFMWLSQRPQNPDGSYQDGGQLLRQLRAFKEENIPVYLAGSPAVRRNWPELEGLVEWVAVPLAFDVADFVARSYPPTGDFDTGTSTEANISARGDPGASVGERRKMESAAFRIARDRCARLQHASHPAPPECAKPFPESISTPMDIVWGSQLNEENHAWMHPDRAPRETSYRDVLLKGHVGVSLDTPFSNTLYVRDLLNPVADSKEEIHRQQQHYLHNKIVLYGANLQGVNDLIFTPARTIQPGVYFHAMALDNLLNWGMDYKSEEGIGGGTDASGLLSHQWISMLAVFPVIVLTALLHYTANRKSACPKLSALSSLVAWGKKYPLLRLVPITLALLAWFGAIAFFEFRYLNYSASVVLGYVQVIVVGFFLEKTETLERLRAHVQRSWQWLHKRIPALKRGVQQ